MKRSENRKQASVVIGYLLILLGIALPLYGFGHISYRQLTEKSAYRHYVEQAAAPTPDEEEGILAYNRSMQENYIVDPFLNENYKAQYEFYKAHPDKVFAYLHIPKLDLSKPIYLDASYAHLDKGVAHIDGTALPVGGESRRSVIAGHRGWYRDLMFWNLHKLEAGDSVTVERNGTVLHYVVADTEVIDPSDWDALQPREGQDILTLLTCDPLRPPRPKRLLVNCVRQESQEAPAEEAPQAPQSAVPVQGEAKVDSGVTKLNLAIYAVTALLILAFAFSVWRFVQYLRG